MKRSVKTILLVCLLLVVCGGYYLVTHMDTTTPVSETAGSFAITAHEAEEVAGLKWRWDGVDWELTRTDGTWRRADSSAFPLNQSLAEAMAQSVASLNGTRKLEDVSDAADYGPDEPAFAVTVTWTDGTVTTLTMGDATPFADGYYLQSSDTPELLYTIADSLSSAFEKTTADLAVFDAIPTLKDVTHLVISSVLDASLTTESGELDGGAHWYAANGTLLDTSAMEELIDTLGSLSWGELVSADASDTLLAEKQLTEETAAVITVSGDDEVLMTLYLGAVDDESGDYFARLSTSRMIYTLDSGTVYSLLTASAASLRPTDLLSVSLTDMAQVSYVTESVSRVSMPVETVSEAEETEDGESSSPEKAFSETDEALWAALTALTMNGYVTDEQPGPLLLTVELTALNGNTATMTIREHSVDSYYLSMTGRDDCLVSADAVDKLLRTLRSVE